MSVFDPNGACLRAWATVCDGKETESPGGVWADGQGRVFVVDADVARACVYDTAGAFAGWWGEDGYDPGQLAGPADIVGDGAGNLYVVEYFHVRVRKFAVK